MSAAPDKRPAYEPAARLLEPVGGDPSMPRPLTTVTGTVLVLLRVAIGLVWAAQLALDRTSLARALDMGSEVLDEETAAVALSLIIGGATVLVAIDLVFAVLVFRGRNGARLVVMFVAVVSITSSFAAWWFDGQEISLTTDLFTTSLYTTALDVLLLLALSSRSAAAYARRNQVR